MCAWQGAQATLVKSVAMGAENPGHLTGALGNLLDEDVSSSEPLPVVRTARTRPADVESLAEPAGPPAGASRSASVRPQTPPTTDYNGGHFGLDFKILGALPFWEFRESSSLSAWCSRRKECCLISVSLCWCKGCRTSIVSNRLGCQAMHPTRIT